MRLEGVEKVKWQIVLDTVDKVRCKRCGKTKNLEFHHIVPVSENYDLAFECSNIRILCNRCHSKVHKQMDLKKRNKKC